MKMTIVAATIALGIAGSAQAQERFSGFGSLGGFATQGAVAGGSLGTGTAEAFQDTGAGVRLGRREASGWTTQQGGAMSDGRAAAAFQGSGMATGVAGRFRLSAR